MRCYLVSTVAIQNENGVFGRKKYAGTRADAAAVKKAWIEEHGIKKSGVDVEEVEIPLAKADLLKFINKLIGVVP